MNAWNFATAVWGRPGVAEACLRLQDRHGQCVTLLLWRAWAAGEGRAVDEAVLARAAAVARTFEGEVIGPLRRARRALGAPAGELAGARALKARAAALELAAEKALTETLEAALADAARAWSGAAPKAEIPALAEGLG